MSGGHHPSQGRNTAMYYDYDLTEAMEHPPTDDPERQDSR